VGNETTVHCSSMHARSVLLTLSYATWPTDVFVHGIWAHLPLLHHHRLGGELT
jgi:hypothetical protein